MRAVNLLPRDDSAQGRKVPKPPVLVGCIGTVLVTAVLAMMFLSASSKVAHQRSALETAESQLSAVPTPPAASPIVAQIPKEKQARVAALATALGQRVVWDRLLREVSEVVPSDVWLVTLDAVSPALPAGATASTPGTTLPSGFTVDGCTYSQASVARFLARLDLVPDLEDMTLGKSSSNSSTAGGDSSGSTCPPNMISFTLQGNVRVGGASS